MKRIFSNVTGQLLHIVYRGYETTSERNDVSPRRQYLQLSTFELSRGKKFKRHKHLPLRRQTDITQQSWVVMSGSVKVTHYDIDEQILNEQVLYQGDITITFRGGHNYEALSDWTRIYQFKTGPYLGNRVDKVLL